jgi:hypothetical protein
MLLNPYPYTEEGSLSFTILVSRAHAGRNPNPALHRDVFEQYEERHFQLPWHDGLPLLDGYGIPRPE